MENRTGLEWFWFSNEDENVQKKWFYLHYYATTITGIKIKMQVHWLYLEWRRVKTVTDSFAPNFFCHYLISKCQHSLNANKSINHIYECNCNSRMLKTVYWCFVTQLWFHCKVLDQTKCERRKHVSSQLLCNVKNTITAFHLSLMRKPIAKFWENDIL